jgi:hypothetical protein
MKKVLFHLLIAIVAITLIMAIEMLAGYLEGKIEILRAVGGPL